MRSLFTLLCAAILAFGAFAAAQGGPAIDTTMEELLGDERTELLLAADKLDLEKLDYSLESLAAIDAWLSAVHATNFDEVGEGKAGETLMNDGRGRNTVTLAGLYLGETVRRNSDLDWEWVSFEDFIAQNPAYAEHYGTDAGLDSYVLVGKQGVATPINSALKRVLNGQQDSVAYIGEFLTTPVDFDKAVEGYDPGPEPDVVRRELDDVEADAEIQDAEDKVNELLDAIKGAESAPKPAATQDTTARAKQQLKASSL